ncbi:MAG: hypothetical protein NC483_00715 [Ruminococcus sp.]|nr:hypothetical protein [Ruminococcus sp.]
MEKEKEVCVLSQDRFKYYWDLLLLNYNKRHTQKLFNLYYSIFRKVEEQNFKYAIEQAIKHQSYFPNVNEIYKYLPTREDKLQQKMRDWENVEAEETTIEEQEELKNLLRS